MCHKKVGVPRASATTAGITPGLTAGNPVAKSVDLKPGSGKEIEA